ncbi:unnamed protein product [Nippostrongylus brasiliensis]|uniref:ATP-dependent DNA helicase n=1 Tax=Nippostrongylus brasiliensis TaxID=27835 RepID=A0A0N4XFH0_NIPBR|nr:unnamed protein product [Nippostrongylus brasiliensis]
MNTTSPEARQIRESELIIWDEISVVPKFALDAADALLKGLMNINADFGGKTVVLGGDIRHVLPIVEREGDAAMVGVSVKNSALWPHFRQHRLRNNMRAATSGPKLKSSGDLLAEVFGDLIPETTRTYESIEELISDDTAQTDFTTKFLNSLSLITKLPLSFNNDKQGTGSKFVPRDIYLPQNVLSHGKLYVALSRAKSRDGVKVLSRNSRVKNNVMRSTGWLESMFHKSSATVVLSRFPFQRHCI